MPSFTGAGDGFFQWNQRFLEHFPNLFIVRCFGENLVAGENPPRVSIYHEDRMVAGVEQNGIGGFGADPVQVEKFFAKLFRGTGKQLGQRALVPLVQKRDEKFQSFCFLPEISRGANQALDLSQRCAADSSNAEQARAARRFAKAFSTFVHAVFCVR
jgi:hypothetical protein